jgi:TgpA N-terminal domain/Transglutaminase-like superfamily
MAAASETTGQADRRVLLGALVALGVVTGVAFGRVFAGTWPAMLLGVTGALAVGVAAATVRRNLALSLLAGVGALLVLMAWTVFPRTTWFGIPTDDTVRAMVVALGRSTERVAKEVAPAPPLDALLAPAMIAVWAAATSAHALAVRSRSTILPIFPGAALLAFAGVVAEDGPRPGYVAAFLAAALAVLYGTSLDRLQAWGPNLAGRWGRAGGLGRWARRLGVAAAAVSVVLPGLLPGFDSTPLIRVDRPGGRVAVNPIVDIRPSLLRNPPAHLFTVRAQEAAYWRMLALDRFDGRLWTASDPQVGDGITVQNGSTLGGPMPATFTEVLQDFVIADLSVPWLPMAYRPSRANVGSGRWDGDAAVMAIDGRTEEGFRYSLLSRLPRASPVLLDRVGLADMADVREDYTALPPTIPAQIHEVAQELTADTDTPFQDLLAIQDYLRGFEYDERAPAGHGVNDMLFFLEQSQRGYCEQFSGTMAVLARSLGYPARVAVGFLPGDRNRDGSFRVTSDDAHAWTEVYFGAEYGWLAFEPTPTRQNPVANYLVTPPTGPRPDANLGQAVQAQESPGPDRGASQRDNFEFEPRNRGATRPAFRPPPVEEPSTVRRLLPWILVAIAVALLLIPPAKALARRRALRRDRAPRAAVADTYGVLLWVADDLGLGRRAGETPWEYRDRLRSEVTFSDGHLDRLTGMAGRALYARDGVTGSDRGAAIEDARAVIRDLRRHAGPGRAVVGAFRPSRPSPGP